MSEASAWMLALLALLFFWMLGAHNRVVALRMAVNTAWAPLEALLQARQQALTELLAAAEPHLTGERAALEAVAAAQAQLAQATDTVRPRPAAEAAIAGLSRADAALGPALARLGALIEQQADLRDDPALAGPLAALREQAPRWQFARQVFNETTATYNSAVQQFPTRLLAPVFRFGRAGTL